MLVAKFWRMGDVTGLVFVKDGVISWEPPELGHFVETYTTAPFVMVDGKHVLTQVRDGGKHLTVADDPEEFVRAMAWSLGLAGSTTVELVET